MESGDLVLCASRYAAAIANVEGELSAPGALPTGRFEGSLIERDEAVPMSADFSDPAAPLLCLRASTHRLRGMRWDRGTLELSAQDSTPAVGAGGKTAHFVLLLWLSAGELRGVLQEEVRDDRPGFARLHGVILKPVR